MGYCAICLPPSVNKFLTSKPCTVMKQYEAISKKTEKNTIIDAIHISINEITLMIFHFISKLDKARVNKVEDVVSVGDEILVKVTEIDQQGRINLSRKDALPAEEETTEQ